MVGQKPGSVAGRVDRGDARAVEINIVHRCAECGHIDPVDGLRGSGDEVFVVRGDDEAALFTFKISLYDLSHANALVLNRHHTVILATVSAGVNWKY